MSKETDKILKAFNALSSEEQDLILIDLNKSKKALEINTMDISVFASRHQKEYGRDITFSITTEGKVISATLHTAYGNFSGVGSNQKIAKLNAVREAEKEW